MTSDARTILREALLLGDGDRADLAVELLASLDGVHDGAAAVASAWAEELDRRAARVLSGEEATYEWPVVRDRVISDLNG